MSLVRCGNGHMFSSRRYGNICPYCNSVVQDLSTAGLTSDQEGNFDQDMPYLGELEVISPVTGWLVCIEGPQLGRDYRIMPEKNFVGRAEDMDIQIIGDNTISRRNHAVIVYDPKKRETLILPGDASGLAYHNNEAVYTPQILKSYDVIQLGTSKFMFVPACGKHFEWESLKEKYGEPVGSSSGSDGNETAKSTE